MCALRWRLQVAGNFVLADLEAALAAALTAKGSGPLPYERLIELVEAGASRGFAISTVDATCDNGWMPWRDWDFHIEHDLLERMAGDPLERAGVILNLAKAAFEQTAPEPDVEFEVWFWRD